MNNCFQGESENKEQNKLWRDRYENAPVPGQIKQGYEIQGKCYKAYGSKDKYACFTPHIGGNINFSILANWIVPKFRQQTQ